VGQIANWNGFVFEVSPNVVRGYTGLTIEGGSQTEDKVSDNYAYVKRKSSTPTAVNLEVYLNAYLGCNVREEAMAFIKAASDGAKNYFYVGGKKLLTCQLMLVNAKVTETTSTPEGEWTSCKIALTMKQCEKYPGGSSSSSSSSSNQPKKESVKQESWSQKVVSTIKDTAATVVQTAKNLVSKAADAMAKLPSSVKTTKSTTTQKAEQKIAATVGTPKRYTSAAKKQTTAQKATTVKTAAAKTTATAKSKIKAAVKK